MAVLVEAISVIVRRDAIAEKLDGGWTAFISLVPNATLCSDGELARVGFMAPDETEAFIDRLQSRGLTFLEEGLAQEIAVVDQQRGPTTHCEWLEFASLSIGSSGGRVAARWLFEGPRLGQGVHLRDVSLDLATPPGWKFECSLSERFTFVETEGD